MIDNASSCAGQGATIDEVVDALRVAAAYGARRHRRRLKKKLGLDVTIRRRTISAGERLSHRRP